MNRQNQSVKNRQSWPLWTAALTLAISAGLGATMPGQAADITVDAGGTCTLDDAIVSANTDTATNGCPAGSGSDTITLETDVLLGDYLPPVTSTIIISGRGHTIDGDNDNTVLINTSDLTLNDTVITGGNGHGGSSSSIGGGIFNTSKYGPSNLTLNSSTVTGNRSFYGGGINNISDNDTASVTLNNSTISGNQGGMGGGILNISTNAPASVVLTNSTVSGNSTLYFGGGILNFGKYQPATVTLTNTTVTGNSSAQIGGGIVNLGDNDNVNVVHLNLHNSLVSGNISPGSGSSPVYGSEIINSYAVISANDSNVLGHSGETTVEAFYGFVPALIGTDVNATNDGTVPTPLSSILNPTLADNGGSTQTHALVVGSPAIDLNPVCSVNEDQRGYPRPFMAGCDAGSYEFGSVLPCGSGRNLPANTWLMTSPPCLPDPAGINAQLGSDLGGVYGVNWITFGWDSVSQEYGAPLAADDLFQPGTGNWLYSTSGGLMVMTGGSASTEPCPWSGGGYCFAVPLTVPADGVAGWNLVGSPYPHPVSWAEVRIEAGGIYYTPSAAEAAGLVSKTYYSWNGNVYETFDDITGGMEGMLEPQGAIWVRVIAPVDVTALTLWIPGPS